MSDPSSLRVADVDRERACDELREHMVAGTLTSEEMEERIGPAAAQAELDARRSRLHRGRLREAGGSASISLVCVAIWLASGASGSFWPIWVIIFTLLPLARDAWHLLGPAPDHEQVEARLAARHARRLARGRPRSGPPDMFP